MTPQMLQPLAAAVHTRGAARHDDYTWRARRGELRHLDRIAGRLHFKLLAARDGHLPPFAVFWDDSQDVAGLIVAELPCPERSAKAAQAIYDTLYLEFDRKDTQQILRAAAAWVRDGSAWDQQQRHLTDYAERLVGDEVPPYASLPMVTLADAGAEERSLSSASGPQPWSPSHHWSATKPDDELRDRVAAWLRGRATKERSLCFAVAGQRSPEDIAEFDWSGFARVLVLTGSTLVAPGEERDLKKKSGRRLSRTRWAAAAATLLLLTLLAAIWPGRSDTESPRLEGIYFGGSQKNSPRGGSLFAAGETPTVEIPAGKTPDVRLVFSEPMDTATVPRIGGAVQVADARWQSDGRTLAVRINRPARASASGPYAVTLRIRQARDRAGTEMPETAIRLVFPAPGPRSADPVRSPDAAGE